MYRPVQNEFYNEWIELHNPSDSNISMENWSLCDDLFLKGYVKRGDVVYLNTTFEIPANGFALITDGRTGTDVYQNFNVTENAVALHVDKATLCGGLINTGEFISLKNSTLHEIDFVNYSSSMGGDGNGNTICTINGTFSECQPTPGLANVLINETHEPEEEEEEEEGTGSICDLVLGITTSKAIYEQETINYNLIVNDTNCSGIGHGVSITYWSEDLFGNLLNGPTITEQDITCYENISRTWTPSDISGSEGYYIKADITDAGCNDTDQTNNFYSKVIIFKGESPDGDCTTIVYTTTSDCPSSSGGGDCICPTCDECAEQSCPITSPEYEILEYEEELTADETFETKVKLSTDLKKNVTVYSYIFDGNNLLTYGFGETWGSTWIANKQGIELEGSEVITLKNKLKEDVGLGTYTLRVRIDDGIQYNVDRDVRVVEKEEVSEVLAVSEPITVATTTTTENDTINDINDTEETEDIITGYAIGEEQVEESKPSKTMMTMYMLYMKMLALKSIETENEQLINANQTNESQP